MSTIDVGRGASQKLQHHGEEGASIVTLVWDVKHKSVIGDDKEEKGRE